MTLSKLKWLLATTPRNVLQRMKDDLRISSFLMEQEGGGAMPEHWITAIDALPETRKLEAVEATAPGFVALAYELLSKTLHALPAEENFNKCFHSLASAKVGEEVDGAALRELHGAIVKLATHSTRNWIGKEALTEMIGKHWETGSTKLKITKKHKHFLDALELAQKTLDPQISSTDRIKVYEQVIKHLKQSMGFFTKIGGAEDLLMRLTVNLAELKNNEAAHIHPS